MARKKKTSKLDDLPAQSDPRAPLNGAALLAAAQPLLKSLKADLGERAAASPAVTAALKARHADEKQSRRTADAFSAWRERLLSQVAASWLLSCVFVRTLEDRGLLGQNRLAGPGATDSQALFFQLAPSLTERDYLLTVFRELAQHPAARDLFDPEHNLVWQLAPSAEAAKELLRLFRTPHAEAPAFRFGQASTRFLGDLYQDLDEDVRKRYALLQTPDFVERFILDRTLEPAIERFGLGDTTVIDPTCGSGHFLLGAFDRLFDHHLRAQPDLGERRAAELALDAVFGTDINPYAVAIARFRLTLAYLGKAGYQRLADAPKLPLHLAVADSLLHNPHKPQTELEHLEGQRTGDWQKSAAFQLEDEAAARAILHRQYAAVVGNPPYITCKDAVLRDVYRSMYPRSAAGKYALAAPFCERFFQLAQKRGYVGQITANSFMKREFGKKLIEDYLPSVNLELIVNTSGAYIPGHGTPTVLLFGTHDDPQKSEVLTVLAKRGEPSTPADPAHGEVWSSVAAHWNELEFENDYISVAYTQRSKLAEHPWSLAGGGATELKALLEQRAEKRLGDICTIGVFGMTNADECMLMTRDQWSRTPVEPEFIRQLAIGEDIRDWAWSTDLCALYPYHWPHELLKEGEAPGLFKYLWPYRTVLWERATFGGGTYRSDGLPWWKWHQVTESRVEGPCIAFAEVATHNHFVLDRGGKVFKQTAPIIKLPETATEDDHLALLAYLNSSTACFWMKQVCYPKATTTGDISVEKGRPEANRYQFAGTALKPLPMPRFSELAHQQALALAREATALSEQRDALTADAAVAAMAQGAQVVLADFEAKKQALEDRLVSIQEDIDWLVYEAFGLTQGVRPTDGGVAEELRPFVAHAAKVPDVWSERAQQIAASKELRQLEDPVFKRLWLGRRGVFGHGVQSFDEALTSAARTWIEVASERAFDEPTALSASEVRRRIDADGLTRVCELAGLGEPATVVREVLQRGDAVPYLAAHRYSASGLKKWAQWCDVWDKQRAEDRGETVEIEVPPKYKDKDYADQRCWRLRGKLDVPKERFISYPGCESDEDGEPVYGWAGWNHLQRAQALATLYQKRKTEEGWGKERLTPMLAGLSELIPWLRQWHNDPDPAYGNLRMADYYQQFLAAECQSLSLTPTDLDSWRPPKKTRGGKKSSKPSKVLR